MAKIRRVQRFVQAWKIDEASLRFDKSSIETIYPSAPHFNGPLKSHKLSQWQPPVRETAHWQRLPIFSIWHFCAHCERASCVHSLECWHTTQRIKYTIIQSIRSESIYFQFQLNTLDDTLALDPICSSLCCLCKYNNNWAVSKAHAYSLSCYESKIKRCHKERKRKWKRKQWQIFVHFFLHKHFCGAVAIQSLPTSYRSFTSILCRCDRIDFSILSKSTAAATLLLQPLLVLLHWWTVNIVCLQIHGSKTVSVLFKNNKTFFCRWKNFASTFLLIFVLCVWTNRMTTININDEWWLH